MKAFALQVLCLSGLLGWALPATGSPGTAYGEQTLRFQKENEAEQYVVDVMPAAPGRMSAQAAAPRFANPTFTERPRPGRESIAYGMREYRFPQDEDGGSGVLAVRTVFDRGLMPGRMLTRTTVDPLYDGALPDLELPEHFGEEQLAASLVAQKKLSARTGIDTGLSFVRRKDESEVVETGLEAVAVPVKWFVRVSPDVDAFLGYRYRQGESRMAAFSPNARSGFTDHYLFAGVEGSVLNPLWSVNLDAGVQQRELRQAGERFRDDLLTLSARVQYAAAPDRNYFAMLSRDFGMDVARPVSYERTRFTIGGQYRVTEVWSALFGLSYTLDELSGAGTGELPAGDRIVGRVGFNFAPNEHVQVEGAYQFHDGEPAGLDRREADAHLLSVTASLRY